MKITLFFLILLSISLSSVGSELRCGWLQNPSPGNKWIIDKDGIWDISSQGGFFSDGIDNLKDFTDKEYVKTNGGYGYGCACIKVDVDYIKKRITKIYSERVLPLARCQNDPNLHRP
ncbi:DUF4087 domain-containing protein [Pantoea agglomerans]|uniref:DUF4087 domain-containing protein n=1 Tax=Enterobacter agglomerans TaxID=549 RepID=UPI00289DDD47|nr:DUF4087 domain-containing protein [Pantoea agglomerans]WNK40773.1 DUF4087 domain-containing protein [Pantoea agglomerans]